ncbi:MAG: RHS repeat-associated core domain-containing protein [Deltaproteobacteria bacterium]|nr:RHS repeat-associated core domain-containing protein [Deltaproteobacteria bacterium]
MGRTVFLFLVSFLMFGVSQAGVDYTHLDAVGSASIVTRGDGAVAQAIQYEPFGESRSGSAATLFLFTGQESDESSDLYYYEARYADLTVARFISSDPIGPSAYLHDPQQLHRYGYARNNPLRYIDPTGGFNKTIDYEVDPETRKVQQKALQRAYALDDYVGMALEAYFDGLDAVANYPLTKKIDELPDGYKYAAVFVIAAAFYVSRGAPTMVATGEKSILLSRAPAAGARAFEPVRTDLLLRSVRAEGESGMQRLEDAIAQAFTKDEGLRSSIQRAARRLYGAETKIPKTEVGGFVMKLQADLTAQLSEWYGSGQLEAHQHWVDVHAQLNNVLGAAISQPVSYWYTHGYN